MPGIRTWVVGLLLLGVAASAIGFALSSGYAANVRIEAGSDWFCAASFQNGVCETQVTAGDTVVWQVVEGIHSVVQCDDTYTTCPPTSGFQSDFLDAEEGGAFSDTFSHTFTTVGTVPYWCSIHPDRMRGRIVVAGQAAPTPTAAPTTTSAPTQGTVSTATSAPSAQTAAPIVAPRTGGPRDRDGLSASSIALAAGVLFLALGTSAGYSALRRR